MKKIALLYGGESPEHNISLVSASFVLRQLLKAGYEVFPIGISTQGCWYLTNRETQQMHAQKNEALSIDEAHMVHIVPGKGLCTEDMHLALDCVFPVLHGINSEDGKIQGALALSAMPYVSADTTSSAIAMNKALTKSLLRDADIPVLPYILVDKKDCRNNIARDDTVHRILNSFSLPIFVKPCSGGSSQGAAKVKEASQLLPAMSKAFTFDTTVLIEPALELREIEVAVIGNAAPLAFTPAEIITSHEFYDYSAKYVDANSAEFILPPDLNEDMLRKIKHYAVQSYQAIACSVMARVDFFVESTHNLYVNEINTIPGFTDISMFPRMVAHDGISHVQMMHRLISLARERHENRSTIF